MAEEGEGSTELAEEIVNSHVKKGNGSDGYSLMGNGSGDYMETDDGRDGSSMPEDSSDSSSETTPEKSFTPYDDDYDIDDPCYWVNMEEENDGYEHCYGGESPLPNPYEDSTYTDLPSDEIGSKVCDHDSDLPTDVDSD